MKKFLSFAFAALFAGSMMAAELWSIDFKATQGEWTIQDVALDSLEFVWAQDSRYGMKATAYADNANHATESWLISPKFDLTEVDSATLHFSHARRYGDLAQLSVLAKAGEGEWDSLAVSAWPDGSNWTFIDATADLAAFVGKADVQVAFRYTSSTENAATWEIASASVVTGEETPAEEEEEEADVVFTGNDFLGQGTSSTGSPVLATKDSVTFACDKAYCDSANATLRCYKNGNITITSETEPIGKLVFQFYSTYTGDLDNEVIVNAKEWTYALPSQARIEKLSVFFGSIAPVDTIVPVDTIAVTCAEAAAAMPEVSETETEQVYIVTGFVTETIGNISPSRTDSTINQQRFWMADEKGGENVLQSYWGNLPDGEKALNVGDKITLTGHILNYNNTPEIKNGDIAILERAEVVPPVEPDTIEVNVAKAVEVALALERGAKSEDLYAVTGYIQSIATEYSAQYKNISFWMADEKDAEESAFQAYRVRCTAEEADKLGANAKVTVIANLQRYFKVDTESGDTIDIPEAAAGGALVILEASTDTIEPIDPTKPIAVTCAEAATAMPEQKNAETEQVYIVTGYVTETIGDISPSRTDSTINQQRFWMADEKGGENVIQSYWGNLPDGEKALNVGDKITLTGHILNYNNTPEIKNGDIAILERAEVVPPVEPDTIEVNVAKAVEVALALERGAKTDNIYAVTGYIQTIAEAYSEQYGNISFWMADEKNAEVSEFEAYRVKCTADEAALLGANAKVTVIAKLQRYYKAATDEKPEIDLAETVAGATLVILEASTDTIEPIDPTKPIAVTCAEAAAAMPEADRDTTAATYIVTGYVTETNGNLSRGQQCFWMDDVKGGGKVFQGYWCNIPEGEDPLKAGDKITLTGRILNYQGTPEIKNGDVVILERAEVIPEDTTKECEVVYLDIDEKEIGAEKITLHLPIAPEIEDFTFIGWQTVEAFIEEGIFIQAIYEYTGDESVAPAEVAVDKTRKLIRNGKVYILRDEKVYSITGQVIK